MRAIDPTRPLNEIMEFDCVIEVKPDGSIVYRPDIMEPELYWSNGAMDYVSDVWELMDGYSSQDRYSGPGMHESESIGGRMERDIRETPGIYVALVVKDLDNATEDETPDAGWAVARRKIHSL